MTVIEFFFLDLLHLELFKHFAHITDPRVWELSLSYYYIYCSELVLFDNFVSQFVV